MTHSMLARQIASLLRRHRVSYSSSVKLFSSARLLAGLRREKHRRRLPKLLPQSSLAKYYEAVDRSGNMLHQLMLRLLFFTAVRVSELCSLRVEDVDFGECKIFLSRGKGGKDRYILFPESFRLALQAYLGGRSSGYLFLTRRHGPFSPRRVRQIVAGYAEQAGIEHVHPHLFRHQMLSYLTSRGLPDSAIQLISGHASKKSLEVYQHLSLEQVQEGYQRAVKELEGL